MRRSALLGASLAALILQPSIAHSHDDHDPDPHVGHVENPSPEPYVKLPTTVVQPKIEANARGSYTNPFAKSVSVIGPSFVRQIHLFELPGSNRLLSCAGSGNSKAHRAGSFTCEVYNWTTGSKRTIKLPSDWFCGAGVYDQAGNLVFAGGTDPGGYPAADTPHWQGSAKSYLLNSRTLGITRLADMNEPRWYNNLLRNWFGDNSIYTWGGIDNGVYSSTWERKRSNSSVWQTLPWRHKNFSYDDYKVLSTNWVAYTGVSATNSGQPPHLLNLNTGQTVNTPGLRYPNVRNAASAIMLYPAQAKKVAVFGGGSSQRGVNAVGAVDRIDYALGTRARYQALAAMPAGVMFTLATNLPNGQVMVTGGTRQWRAGSVRWSAIYTPWTNRWTVTSPAKVARNYHSNIVTRTDGRVMTFGGNPSDGSHEQRSELFTPWYMWRPRPTILRYPRYVKSNRSYLVDVRFPRGTKPGQVTLDSPRSTTHSASDTNYGLFAAKATVVKRTGRVYRMKLSFPSASSVPLGYYKVSFVTRGVVSRRGASGKVPSRSVWVRITP